MSVRMRLFLSTGVSIFCIDSLGLEFFCHFFPEQLTEFPTLAVIAPNERLGIGGICHTHLFCVPVDFLAGAIRDVAEVVGLSQQSGILKVAHCRSAVFARVDPVLMMATSRAWYERVRPFEAGEGFFWKQNMFIIIG